ncbi:MAG: hypothetical protein IJ069_11795 [Prevotella sp.]|nr:hypothetical protein [Prevotella sp.]
MKKISIMTLLALFATTLTHQGGAWAQDSDTKDDNWGQVKTVTSEWTHITEGSTSGYELKDAYYYVTEDLTFTNTLSGPGQGSGMYVQADKTVTLYIPAGVTLTVKGADAEGTTGAGAGILLPEGTTLNIIGAGTLVATGGKAANGQDGSRGTDGHLDEESVDTWFLGKKIYCGYGGAGGYGGGGAGAGIGTAGGQGGAGASAPATASESYAEWEGGDLPGVVGVAGGEGGTAAAMGTLNIEATITQDINGGAMGTGGAAGWPGNVSTTGGEIEFEGVTVVNGIPIPTFDITDMQAVAGGGGGGGGAGGGSAQAIGTGGAGGGGGASGASGSACAHNSWTNDNWGSVGAGGGAGGIGTGENNGANGYTCWFQGEDNIFDDDENHKPGGVGGYPGTASVDKSSAVGAANAPTYNVKFYAVGVTPSTSNSTYQVGSTAKVTLPSLNQGDSKYKWILSIYGNVLGETSGHCGGPNGDVYASGDEVKLSNIYGDIEFCAVYVGCEIECADEWSSSYSLAYNTAFTQKYTIVDLKGRKLYKDGYWNTLTLPFSLSAEKLATTCLAGADIRRFKNASWDSENKKLTINFSESNEEKIDAGVPYIIRWGTPETATGEVINNPSFANVTISNDLYDNEELDDPDNTYETTSGGLTFEGQIAPVQVTASSRSLLLGAENKLYKPQNAFYVYATRAYFTYTQSSGISMAREITLDFGGGEQISTSIENVETDGLRQNTIEGIFNLNGQRLFAPRKGLNIINGKKVIIK